MARPVRLAEKKPSKYRAVPTFVNGIRFASKKEANRYSELKLLERAGEISNLRRQVRFALIVEGTFIASYVADFVYWEKGYVIVEDVKEQRTRDYLLKKKLMWAIYKKQIRET